MQQKILQQLAACRLQLSYKRPANALCIAHTSHSVEMFRSIWDDSLMDIQEQCYVLYLGKSNRLICWRCLHTGGTDSLAIDIKLLLGVALVCLAGSFVLAHNHPSGNVQPSKADVAFTNRIRTACATVDIPMLDHLILTRTETYSFAEEMW